MASDAISFFRIGRRGLTAEMRRSGTCLEDARSRVWRISLPPPSGNKSSCKWNATKAVCWTASWTSRTNRQHSHHGHMWSREICRAFRRMNEESRCNVDSWIALRGLFWNVTERGAEAAEAVRAPTSSNYPSASGVTSALRHEGRLGKVWCDDRLLCVVLTLLFMGRHQKPHTEECRTRIGEQMEHDPKGPRTFASSQRQMRCGS